MAKHHVSAAARGLPSHPAVFLAITPEIRRALELLAEASITLLDEIDAPVDGREDGGDDEPSLGWIQTERGLVPCSSTDDREIDDDFEHLGEDDEDGGDDEAEPFEPDLGWTEDGQIGGGEGWEGIGSDDDFADPETSAGFPRGEGLPYEKRAAQKALFDPRIERRGQVASVYTTPTGHRIGVAAPPRFPHEPPGRVRFYVDEEMWRLRRQLAELVPKRHRRASAKK